jgi:hypothetical protein
MSFETPCCGAIGKQRHARINARIYLGVNTSENK